MNKHRREGAGIWRVVGTNIVAKILVLGVSGVFSIITTRVIVSHFGVAAYAQYGLLSTMGSLVPFADLGMGAVILNSVAGSSRPASDPQVRRTLVSAIRVVTVAAVVLALIAITISVFGLWPLLLGGGLLPGGSSAALWCVLVFAIALPLGVGQRILTGLGRNELNIRAQFIPAPFTLLAVLATVVLGLHAGNALAVLTYLSGLLVGVVTLLIANHLISPQLVGAARDTFRFRAVPGEPVMHIAGPMLIQMLALPIAMQTDRLLLSHLSSTSVLAQYNLSAQFFGLITQTISTAGVALWPIFAKARTNSELRTPVPLAVGFGVGGLIGAGVLGAVMPWVAPLVSGGQISLGFWLIMGWVVFVAAQALKYPLGMYMTDARGLRFQVAPILILVPVNLGISWALVTPLGAAGPVIGSAIAVAFCQVVPNWIYVRRDLVRRRRAIEAAVSVAAGGT